MIKYIISLLYLVLFGMSSCNTSFKTLQTPDDVYYSTNIPDGIKEQPVDRNIRMRSRDHRWREFDDWRYDPYHYGYNNPYYYNPYYSTYPVFGYYTWGTSVTNSSPVRMTNLGSYYNTETKAVNIKTGVVTTSSGPSRYNNSNNGGNTRTPINSGGTRTYSPSNRPSGGGAPVTRPSRN